MYTRYHIIRIHCQILYYIHCKISYYIHCKISYYKHCKISYYIHCKISYYIHYKISYYIHCKISYYIHCKYHIIYIARYHIIHIAKYPICIAKSHIIACINCIFFFLQIVFLAILVTVQALAAPEPLFGGRRRHNNKGLLPVFGKGSSLKGPFSWLMPARRSKLKKKKYSFKLFG